MNAEGVPHKNVHVHIAIATQKEKLVKQVTMEVVGCKQWVAKQQING